MIYGNYSQVNGRFFTTLFDSLCDRCKNPHPVTNVVSTSFVEKADLVSDILSRIWGQSLETRACIQESLRLFYVIISTSDSDSRPSCALMSFIDKVPSNMMEKAMETIIDDSNHTHIQTEEGRTVVGLLVIRYLQGVQWLILILQSGLMDRNMEVRFSLNVFLNS